MFGLLEGLELGSSLLGMLRRKKSGGNLRDLFARAQGTAADAEQEAAGMLPGSEAADSDYRAALNRRLASLANVGSPDYDAARMAQLTAPGRSAYESALSRLRQSLEARGLSGSSVASGGLASLEAARAGSEAQAGQRVALEGEARRDAASRESLNLQGSYANSLRARLEAARRRALAARAQAGQAGQQVDRQDMYDEGQQGAALGSGAELLAGLSQKIHWPKRAARTEQYDEYGLPL